MKNATLTEATTKRVCEKIFEMLSKQQFFEWYGENGKFEDFISDSESGITKEEILNDIRNMLNL
jgi:hypothetical protein